MLETSLEMTRFVIAIVPLASLDRRWEYFDREVVLGPSKVSFACVYLFSRGFTIE